MKAIENSINKKFLAALQELCPKDKLVVGAAEIECYGQDIATNKTYDFDYLVKPTNEQEVAEIVKLCNAHNVSITPRAGGSGVSGGAMPTHKGLVLSTENLNQIIEIDSVNKTAIVESGVLTDSFCKKVEDLGLYFPVKPTSSYMSFVGGNVASNCGSINSLKYGSVSNYVLNLQVVLANGEIIWTGANTSKNATGPNITQLITGSEGTLAIITKVVFKLIPKPTYTYSLKAEFNDMADLCKTVMAISESNLEPCAIELVDGYATTLTASFLQLKTPSFVKSTKPHLLVSFDGSNEVNLDLDLEKCFTLVTALNDGEVLVAKTHAEKESLWEIRMNIGEALKHGGKGYRDIDMAVPVSKLHDYIAEVKKISGRYNIQIACFGHAGNGNLHTMVSLNQASDLVHEETNKAIQEIYKTGIDLGGTISGEHGVGMLQKQFMPLQYSHAYLDLVSEIKKVFDPKNLINPGKII